MVSKIKSLDVVSKISFLLLILVLACSQETVMPVMPYLQTEEYLTNDPTVAGSSGEFVRLYKKKYLYDKGKLVAIDISDYNQNLNNYDPPYRIEEFVYSSDGKLSQSTQFIGQGIKVIKEYTYPSEATTQITRYESSSCDMKILQDWWVMEKTPSELTVKYYQLNNELYAQLNYTIDGKGNVSSLNRDPAFPTGTIYYEYDSAPNPFRFSGLAGEYGVDSERYISTNNVISILNDTNNKSTYSIEYGIGGYPISVSTSTFKKLFTY